MIAVFLALVLFAVGNALGTALLKISGFGLISLSRSTSPGWWRAPLARLSGPLLIYLVAVAAFAIAGCGAEVATAQLQVVPGLPAEAAGLRTGDRVVEVNGAPVSTFPDLSNGVRAAGPGKSLELVVDREGQRVISKVAINEQGVIGVRPSGERVKRSWGGQIAGALGMPFRAVAIWGRDLWRLATTEQIDLMSGPIGLVEGRTSPSWVAPLFWSLGMGLSGIGFLLALAALATQVVALARAELRAPTPGGG